MLLAVACANLAGLALARSLTRRHQVAIRLALGGSRARVFWQLLSTASCCRPWRSPAAVPLAWGDRPGRDGVAHCSAVRFASFRT
jgi:hypothetical protein